MDHTDRELLTGGNMDPVLRVGDTVRRTAGPWTPAVHRLLRRLNAVSFSEAPRPLGLDEENREILTFIPGEVIADLPPAELWSPALLKDAAAMLRRFHEATAPLIPDKGPWRSATHHPVEVICHNDFAPYNLILRNGRVSGVIDFDMASPGSRLWDLAYLAYRLAPFAEDAVGLEPNRDGDRETRLKLLIEAYGVNYSISEVLEVAAERLDELAEFTDQRAVTTGRSDFTEHAAMYRRDAQRLRTKHGS
ncbi:phosphotransferase [Nesterenkonia sp. MY13]|uniref:Phosphotransferase n=1 Tax=Nesterenkonia sedimenti TaxID=1463632 RepID=A0A7X8TLP7_9MICC|nr:phosphotransferase [Nesterenkonia sedimenti]NLS10998.1 phosphotransferase [Nesterenkonia sedimenti]